MKKHLISIILLLSLSCLFSCFDSEDEIKEEYTATYIYGDGRENASQTVESGSKYENKQPIRDGYIFVGWCNDETLASFYNFDLPVSSSVSLYAKWSLDYEALLSEITHKAMPFNVKIESNFFLGLSGESNQGSGIIYKEDDDYYYVLTNNHVVAKETSLIAERFVYDMYANKYEADFIAGDAKYDLAILKIRKIDNVKLSVADIASRIPGEKETVITLTAQKGQLNAIEFGETVNYRIVENSGTSDESNITFEVLWLSAYANHGSSGGAVLDTDMNVIGIIYAVATNSDGEFLYTFAIPGERVLEFINTTNN